MLIKNNKPQLIRNGNCEHAGEFQIATAIKVVPIAGKPKHVLIAKVRCAICMGEFKFDALPVGLKGGAATDHSGQELRVTMSPTIK